MHFTTFAVVVSLLPVAYALRCHIVSTATSLDVPMTSTAQECPNSLGYALSCVKAVDMQFRTYTKNCAYTNCTNPLGQNNQPAGCYNMSTVGREAYSCCCYGDGCNSGPKPAMIIAGVTVLVSFFF